LTYKKYEKGGRHTQCGADGWMIGGGGIKSR